VICAIWTACAREHPERDAGGPSAGPQQLAEKEPNDRPDQAMVLSESSVVTASLTADPSRPDEDWYLLAPSAPRVADITVSGIPGADVMMEVFDADRNRLLTVNSEGEGKPERIPNLGVKQRLLIRVTGAKRGAGGAYTLTVLYSEPRPGFEFEPNDRAADANAVPLGQPVSGFIGHASDEDWYRFELPADAASAGALAAGDGGESGGPVIPDAGDIAGETTSPDGGG
jgi:hypothetical protein